PALRPAAERALLARIAADPRVRSATFVPRAEGLRQLETRLRGEVDTSLLTQNPLPDAIRVHVSNPAAVSAVAAALGRMPGVADVVYARDAVARLLALWSVLERIGLGTLALLLLAAAIVISNAIRLTVFARRREIAIMQLVGGSGTYVRLPFICEGIVDGLLGALLALVLLALARAELFPRLVAALPFLPFESAARADPLLAAELVGIGAVVGAVAAWLAVGRYLRA
ncbi:MAG: cell division protein FtsX, partial [Candidatus Dormibacteria bacterium]